MNLKNFFERIARGYPDFILRYRVAIVIAFLLATAAAASGLPRLYLIDDYRYMFSPDNPQLRDFDALEKIYTKNDNVLFVIAPKNGDVFTRENLAMLEDWTKESWQVPYSIRVDSITNFQHTEADGDDLIVMDLVKNATELSDAEIEKRRTIALKEPMLIQRLITPTSAVTGINVTLQLPGKSNQESTEVSDYANALRAKMQEKYPDTEVYISGVAMLSYAFYDSSMKDASRLIPLMYVMITLFIWISLRSWLGTALTVSIIAMSCLSAMGIYGHLKQVLSGPSAQAPTIITTLAVADCIHFLTTVLDWMRQGMSKEDAIRKSLDINSKAMFLTSITTVFGFLGMNFSDVPSFWDLGNITAIGITAAWLYAIVFLPAAIAVLPLKPMKNISAETAAMDRFADFVIAKRKPLFWGSLLAFAILAAFIPKNDLNDEFVEYFDERIPFRRDTDFMLKNLTGIYLIDYSLSSGESGGVSDPAYLHKLEEFSDWYRKQPEVVHVSTFTDTMKRLNYSLHGDDRAWYRIPDSRELAAQYLLLYEFSLPYGLDINNQINVDKSSSRFTVTTKEVSSKELRALAERSQTWLRENAPEAMFSHGVGTAMMFAYISGRNIKSMLFGTFCASVMVSFCLIFAFKSVRLGLLSLLPNLIPPAMGFGLWGLLVGQVGLGLSVVSSITFGIIVDDTIHFMLKYVRAKEEHQLGTEDAIRYAMHSVGRAIIATSVILVAGFLVLALSSFRLNADLGRLTAITILIGAVFDLLFLPALLCLGSKFFHETSGDSK